MLVNGDGDATAHQWTASSTLYTLVLPMPSDSAIAEAFISRTLAASIEGLRPFVASRRVTAGLQNHVIEIIEVIQFGKESDVPQADKPDF